MTVNDNTIKAKDLGKFLENLGKTTAKASNKPNKDVREIPRGASKNGSKFGSAVISKNPKVAVSITADCYNF